MPIAAALLAGLCLDLRFGDPRWLPHPVAGVGRAVTLLERALRTQFPATPRGEFAAGAVMAAVVAAGTFLAAAVVLEAAAAAHPLLGWALEAFMCFQSLAARGLRDAAMDVCLRLERGDLAGARRALSMIVGRDTGGLDEGGAARAAVETVAENASDGVIAPMLYFAVGGAPLALLYKAVNTMDSMVGYKNGRYLYFGRAAARLDDAANFVPARLTGLLMVAAAGLCRLDWRGALRVLRRDGKNHDSPNSGHPEAACAGALGVRLGGDSTYGGRPAHRPGIGDARHGIAAGDVRRACRLLYATAGIGALLCCCVRLGAHALSGGAA